MLSFLKTKKTKIREAKVSLKEKVQKMVSDLAWTKQAFGIEKIVDFFNYMEEAMKQITPKEFAVADKYLLNVIRTTGRQQYGWFRAPKGSPATPDNTFIQPTGHWDEFFRTHTVRLLMDHKDQPSDQGGFAKRPMTTREFYLEAFVKPFILDKIEALQLSMQES